MRATILGLRWQESVRIKTQPTKIADWGGNRLEMGAESREEERFDPIQRKALADFGGAEPFDAHW
jgi:hypothetical protein